MFGDILDALVRRPATERYPFERREAPAQLRGRLLWDPEACVGCNLCVKDCPAHALELITIDKKAKRFVLRYHEDRCTYCAQCVCSCRKGCLSMSSEQWELAARDKSVFVVHYGDAADVAHVLENEA
jgi:formate hydrogenlyase subunit 6/NADH:ubiquinone oxidoreductase subunit I